MRTHLELEHILHASGFAIAHAGLKETGGHGHAQRLAGHSGGGVGRIARDDPECAEQ